MTLDYFICRICKLVVSEPVECRLCEQLFCNSCLTDYLNNSQESCCPLGCPEPTFERVGHAFDKLMGFVYVKCKNFSCMNEDCIKHIHKHELICKNRQDRMEIEVSEDLLSQRDMFWLQIINRIMTPRQYSCNYLSTPLPFQANNFPVSPYTQNGFTPSSFLSMTPKPHQTFKF
jgi:hypothetical protein